MKIEKVNDNQIRCTLTREDLADRQIKLSELAYGSEKARSLFRDMIQQANYEFGFDASDIPLMVEAIPISTESIILVITKVEYPDELDTRFSKFSEADESYLSEDGAGNDFENVKQRADDVIDFFKTLSDVKAKSEEKNEEKKDNVTEEPKKAVKVGDMTKLFEFTSIDDICRLSRTLSGYYQGENYLYKDERNNKYYLAVHKNEHTPVEFNKICNMISEYAYQKNYTTMVGAYFAEHGELIIAENAIQTLAQI